MILKDLVPFGKTLLSDDLWQICLKKIQQNNQQTNKEREKNKKQKNKIGTKRHSSSFY
jgi:hypothetical protein